MVTTILQLIISVIMQDKTLDEAFAFFNINTRNGFVLMDVRNVQKIQWIRGENTDRYYRTDKKGRLFVARKFEDVSFWQINPLKNYKLSIKPAIIQMNVLRASGKRGGYLIRLHMQTPLLSKTGKFQFQGKWVGYWASEQMLEAGLWTKSVRGKFGKPSYINDTVPFMAVKDSVDMLNGPFNEEIIDALQQGKDYL